MQSPQLKKGALPLSLSTTEVVIGQVDSPQKKLQVSHANRATNFKLGISGKHYDEAL